MRLRPYVPLQVPSLSLEVVGVPSLHLHVGKFLFSDLALDAIYHVGEPLLVGGTKSGELLFRFQKVEELVLILAIKLKQKA